jgi:hypothetical protein
MDSPALVARMENFELSVGFPEQSPRMCSLLDCVVLTTLRLSMDFNAYVDSCINTDNSTFLLRLL